jgi:hypothetical protein
MSPELRADRPSQKADLAITPALSRGDENPGVRKLVLFVALAVAASGCGGSKHVAAPPIRPQEWRAVVDDWLDNGRIDIRHRCGAVVEALAHLRFLERIPAPTYNPRLSFAHATSTLDRYAASVCPRTSELSKIVVGMSDAEVANVAGMPRTPRLRCWLYPVTRAHDGRRVCFAHGRVALVQTSVHF